VLQHVHGKLNPVPPRQKQLSTGRGLFDQQNELKLKEETS
jgi:hypothetical protein